MLIVVVVAAAAAARGLAATPPAATQKAMVGRSHSAAAMANTTPTVEQTRPTRRRPVQVKRGARTGKGGPLPAAEMATLERAAGLTATQSAAARRVDRR